MALPIRYALTWVLGGFFGGLVGVVVYTKTSEPLGALITLIGLAAIVVGLVLLAVYGIVRFIKVSARD